MQRSHTSQSTLTPAAHPLRAERGVVDVTTFTPQPSTLNRRSRAFTMIELVIVMGIMALLVGLLVVAIAPTLDGARVAAVKATMTRIDQVIQQRVKAIQDLDVSADAKKLAALNTAALNPPLVTDLTVAQATFIIKKTLYRQALPQRPEDLWGLDQDRTTAFDNAPYFSNSASNHNWISAAYSADKHMSSALLHFALVDGKSIRAFAGGQPHSMPVLVEDGFKSEQHHEIKLGLLKDIDVEAFFDEWDEPLRFYNFPTQLMAASQNTTLPGLKANIQSLLPGLPSTLNRDPLDPVGNLHSRFSSVASVYYAPAMLLDPVDFDLERYHDPGVYYAPVLISAGPDQELGLAEPYGWDPLPGSGAVNVNRRCGFPLALHALADFSPATADEQARWLGMLNDNITNKQR